MDRREMKIYAIFKRLEEGPNNQIIELYNIYGGKYHQCTISRETVERENIKIVDCRVILVCSKNGEKETEIDITMTPVSELEDLLQSQAIQGRDWEYRKEII